MTAYSITPEGATEAAKEIVDRNADRGRSYDNSPDYLETAAIILRHAEQSLEGMKTPWCLNGHEVLTPGCESCLLDLQKRYNDALRKVQGEGEMREALREVVKAIYADFRCLCDPNLDIGGAILSHAPNCPVAKAEALLGPAGREEKP